MTKLKSELLKSSALINKIIKLSKGALKRGMEVGDDVRILQMILRKIGYTIDIDGVFGGDTKAVVKMFQIDRELLSDGVVGCKTLLELDAVLLSGWMHSTLTQTTQTLSNKGRILLQDIEQLRLMPYDDQTGKTIKEWVKGATIGYGYLIPEKEWVWYKNGIDKETADRLFSKTLQPFENNINKKISRVLDTHQFDALVIFSYNVGIANFNNSSVLKLINGESVEKYNNDLNEAWMAWNKSQGKVMNGLIKRRQCELNVYNECVYTKW